MIEARLEVSKEFEEFVKTLPKRIVEEAFPKVERRLRAKLKHDLREMLPESPRDADGQRVKQSDSAARRFPDKAKSSVGSKSVKDVAGALLIVGIASKKAGHIHFDWGDKAMGVGRWHVLWGSTGDGTTVATGGPGDSIDDVYKSAGYPRFRRNMEDIPAKIIDANTGFVESVANDEINRLVS